MTIKFSDIQIGIIGLGYVGLPLAVEFSKKFPVIGFDLNKKRVVELSSGVDITREVQKKDFHKIQNLHFSSNENQLSSCNVYIITVPTPVDNLKKPDFKNLWNKVKNNQRGIYE